MKRLLGTACILLLAIPLAAQISDEGEKMQIIVESDGKMTLFQLNASQAAKELYAQLPLETDVKDYSDNEKIFYPPGRLAIRDTPLANAKRGTLAYYAPWGNVVMFYADFGSVNGLYELGDAVSGAEHIKNMSGKIRIKPD